MRKFAVAIAAVLAVSGVAVFTGTATASPQAEAAAAAGLAGPFKTKLACEKSRKAYAQKGYKVGPCGQIGKAWYFKFA